MYRRFLFAFLLLPFLAWPVRAADPQLVQWIVVTAPAFRTAIEPLCAQRRADGMQVVVIQTTDVLSADEIVALDARKLVECVRGQLRQHPGPSTVLLVGAVLGTGLPEPAACVVPALPGTVSRMRGQPSDNAYGCPNGDPLPTVAVGRFPARTVEEAQDMVRKTLAYERTPQPGLWKQHLTVLAGVPAFNPVVDKLVETLALGKFGQLDGRWTVRALYHNPNSRFCVPDNCLHNRASNYVEEGQAVTLYLGHSWAKGFYAPNARFLEREDWAALKIRYGPGIFAIFGCNGCQLWGTDGEGYGLAAMRNAGGPVAVLGSHGVCFAAMCQLAADGMLRSVGSGQMPDRLGDLWLAVKQGIAFGKIDPLAFRLLDAADGDTRIPMDVQRLEHLEMFLMLGDPALRLPRIPEGIHLEAEGRIAAGGVLKVEGVLPPAFAHATVHLRLERPLTSTAADLHSVPAGPPERRNQILLANHERANQFILMEEVLSVRQGRFTAIFELPDRLPWSNLVIRAYALSGSQEVIGVATVRVSE